jgi:hypothetical protein
MSRNIYVELAEVQPTAQSSSSALGLMALLNLDCVSVLGWDPPDAIRRMVMRLESYSNSKPPKIVSS